MFNARMKGSGKAKSLADFGRFVAAAAVEADDGGKTRSLDVHLCAL